MIKKKAKLSSLRFEHSNTSMGRNDYINMDDESHLEVTVTAVYKVSGGMASRFNAFNVAAKEALGKGFEYTEK